jgi:hypothetical protein
MSALEHLTEIAALILLLWSAVLLWATWRLHRLARAVEAQRQAVRRWQRLEHLAKGQNVQWQ